MSGQDTEPDLGWCVLELMGHRKLAGYVSERGPLFRIDVYVQDPDAGGKAIATQLYAPAALYCITPTTKANCLALARRYQPEPVARWELPAPNGGSDEVMEALEADMDEDDRARDELDELAEPEDIPY